MQCEECKSWMKYNLIGNKYICSKCGLEIRLSEFQDANFND